MHNSKCLWMRASSPLLHTVFPLSIGDSSPANVSSTGSNGTSCLPDSCMRPVVCIVDPLSVCCGCLCRAKWRRASSHLLPPTPPGNPHQPAGRFLTPLAQSVQQQVVSLAMAQGSPATRPQQGLAAALCQGLATLQQQGTARGLGHVLAWARVCKRLEGTLSCGSSHAAAAATEQQQA